MSVFCVAIARITSSGGPTLLSYYQDQSRPSALYDVRLIIDKVPTVQTKVSSELETKPNFWYHLQVDGQSTPTLVFVCVSENDLPKQKAQQFLDTLRTSFGKRTDLSTMIRTCGESGLQEEFGSSLADHVSEFNAEVRQQPPSKVDNLRGQVNEVTDIMKENVQGIIERGERLDDLQGRSEELSEASTEFRSTAGQVRRRMCFRNWKMNIIIAVVVFIVLLVIILVTLGELGLLGGSKKSDTKTTPTTPKAMI